MTVQTKRGAISDERAATIDANLELSRRFFAAAFDDPSLLDDLPTDATLILIPVENPDLARQNLAAAGREASQGKRVVLRIVGVASPEHPERNETQAEQLGFQTLRPRWPERADRVHPALHYFQDTDTLVIRFFADRPLGVPVPWRGPTFLLLDLASQEVVGYLLPRFLRRIAPDAPRLLDWLRQATVHAKTPAEVRQAISDVVPERRPAPTVAAVRAEIGDLTVVG